MATRQEIIDTIEEGKAIVKQTYSGLSEQQAQIRVGSDSDGWTAKEVLAHLAGRKPSYERLIQMARGESTSLSGGIDERNEEMVAARRNTPLPDILKEFNAVSDWVIEQARTLPDETLAAIVPLPQRAIPLSDLLRAGAGTHTISHTKEVQEALAKAK